MGAPKKWLELSVTTCLCLAVDASAGTVVSQWEIGATGDWSDASLWSSTDFPNNGNGGETFDAEIGLGGDGSEVITLDQDITIDRLRLAAGTLTVDVGRALMLVGDGTPATESLWNVGRFTGAGTSTLSGGLTIFDTNNSSFTNPELAGSHRLVNTGQATLAGGQEGLNIEGGAVFENQGTFLLEAAPVAAFNFATPGTIENTATGIISKSAGSGTASINVIVDNDGIVQVQQGTLQLTNQVTGEGAFDAAVGTQLFFTGGNASQDLGAGSELKGDGTIAFFDGVGTIAGTFNVTGSTRFQRGSATTITSTGNQVGSLWIDGGLNTIVEVSGGRVEARFVLTRNRVRRGELLGLKWKDVDFERSRIHVRRAYVRGQPEFLGRWSKDRGGLIGWRALTISVFQLPRLHTRV